jgi:predicted amidohydrolase YtcJ
MMRQIVLMAAFAALSSTTLHAQDFVVMNANVYTVDQSTPRAEAFAVVDGRFQEIGSNEIVRAAHPDLAVVDAGWQTVIPGLIDAHAHLMGLGTSMLQADLMGAGSVDDVVDRLRAFAHRLPEGAWITGRGWDQNQWPVALFPTRSDLDEVFPDRPVWLRRVDGHAAWANTAALEAAGIEQIRTADDPEGGAILRDSDGEPTGVFIDTAMRLVDRIVPEIGAESRVQALRLALGETARFGITGVHDAGVSLDDVNLYHRAIDEGWFALRLYGMVGGRGETFDHFCENGFIKDHGDDRLTIRSVKFYMDGALGSRGAALLDDYSDDVGNRGLLMQEPGGMETDVRRAVECGFQINTHAIGDRGNRVVLDAYERGMSDQQLREGRHRIEHVQVATMDDLRRFRQMNVIASMQPTHATSDMYWAEDRVGSTRILGAYAWQTLLRNGARVAFGSDFPVEYVDPMLGLAAAVTRQDAEGYPEGGWYPEERVTREEALRGFTIDAAYAGFSEDKVGSISQGKWADFVILDRDVMTIDANDIRDVRVVATYLAGEPIYEISRSGAE